MIACGSLDPYVLPSLGTWKQLNGSYGIILDRIVNALENPLVGELLINEGIGICLMHVAKLISLT